MVASVLGVYPAADFWAPYLLTYYFIYLDSWPKFGKSVGRRPRRPCEVTGLAASEPLWMIEWPDSHYSSSRVSEKGIFCTFFPMGSKMLSIRAAFSLVLRAWFSCVTYVLFSSVFHAWEASSFTTIKWRRRLYFAYSCLFAVLALFWVQKSRVSAAWQ